MLEPVAAVVLASVARVAVANRAEAVEGDALQREAGADGDVLCRGAILWKHNIIIICGLWDDQSFLVSTAYFVFALDGHGLERLEHVNHVMAMSRQHVDAVNTKVDGRRLLTTLDRYGGVHAHLQAPVS